MKVISESKDGRRREVVFRGEHRSYTEHQIFQLGEWRHNPVIQAFSPWPRGKNFLKQRA